MRVLITILTTIFLASSMGYPSYKKKSLIYEINSPCKTERDYLTKRIVYTTADKEAANEGGQSALTRQFAKITLDSIPEDLDTKFIIAFIVETDGRITSERIIKDKTGLVGQQMIKITKSFKWTPAECNGEKIPMLVQLPLQMCPK